MQVSRASRSFVAGLLLAAAAPLASAQTVLQTELGSGMDDAAITPDGRLGVVREHDGNTVVRILDMSSGQQLAAITCVGLWTGVAQDAVAVTNERAVVIGSCLTVIDLSDPAFPVLGQHPVGVYPRDLEITPDGTRAAVRGGSSISGATGGLFVVDLSNGALVGQFPGEPTPYYTPEFDVDSVVTTNEHAVFVSAVSGPSVDTRVTVVGLRPADGGPARVLFETGSGTPDQPGWPHDVTLLPDGRHAAVRSDSSIALYRLRGARSTQVWQKPLFGAPGPFGASALDSVESGPGRIATISRVSNGGVGSQLDVFDLRGRGAYDRFPGDPHDLALTPDGVHLVVRTSAGVFLYGLGELPDGGRLAPLDEVRVGSTHTSFGAGLDSVAVNERQAVTLHRTGSVTDVRIWSLAGGALTQTGSFLLPNRPCDVAISPDGRMAAVAGTSHVQVFDLATSTLRLDFDPVVGAGVYPWCNGVVMDDSRVLAFGYSSVSGISSQGWLTTIDLLAH